MSGEEWGGWAGAGWMSEGAPDDNGIVPLDPEDVMTDDELRAEHQRLTDAVVADVRAWMTGPRQFGIPVKLVCSYGALAAFEAHHPEVGR